MGKGLYTSPSGWIMVADRMNMDRIYFFNENSKKTQWMKPEDFQPLCVPVTALIQEDGVFKLHSTGGKMLWENAYECEVLVDGATTPVILNREDVFYNTLAGTKKWQARKRILEHGHC